MKGGIEGREAGMVVPGMFDKKSWKGMNEMNIYTHIYRERGS